MPDNTDLLRAEMDRQGITDNQLRAGLAAIIGGEGGFKPTFDWPSGSAAKAAQLPLLPSPIRCGLPIN